MTQQAVAHMLWSTLTIMHCSPSVVREEADCLQLLLLIKHVSGQLLTFQQFHVYFVLLTFITYANVFNIYVVVFEICLVPS